MPLGAFEREVLRLLAVNRNPDSYVAGATVLNQDPCSDPVLFRTAPNRIKNWLPQSRNMLN